MLKKIFLTINLSFLALSAMESDTTTQQIGWSTREGLLQEVTGDRDANLSALNWLKKTAEGIEEITAVTDSSDDEGKFFKIIYYKINDMSSGLRHKSQTHSIKSTVVNHYPKFAARLSPNSSTLVATVKATQRESELEGQIRECFDQSSSSLMQTLDQGFDTLTTSLDEYEAAEQKGFTLLISALDSLETIAQKVSSSAVSKTSTHETTASSTSNGLEGALDKLETALHRYSNNLQSNLTQDFK